MHNAHVSDEAVRWSRAQVTNISLEVEKQRRYQRLAVLRYNPDGKIRGPAPEGCCTFVRVQQQQQCGNYSTSTIPAEMTAQKIRCVGEALQVRWFSKMTRHQKCFTVAQSTRPDTRYHTHNRSCGKAVAHITDISKGVTFLMYILPIRTP